MIEHPLTDEQRLVLLKALDATSADSPTFHIRDVLPNPYSIREYNILYCRLRKHPAITWVGNGQFRVTADPRLPLSLSKEVEDWADARKEAEIAELRAEDASQIRDEALNRKNAEFRNYLAVAGDPTTTKGEYIDALYRFRIAEKEMADTEGNLAKAKLEASRAQTKVCAIAKTNAVGKPNE